MVKTENAVITDYFLYQNYPNPFNGVTKIRFNVKGYSQTELIVSDLLGRRIRTYTLGKLSTGSHEVTWDGNDELGNPVASGIYLYQVSFNDDDSGKLNLSKKMVFLK
ncbi:MAG: FlgD immunoglobulin-like domain containing protein [Bacillota bacterium]